LLGSSSDSKGGWSWGCVASVDATGHTIWIADAHRDDGTRVHAEEKLAAFLELEAAVRADTKATYAQAEKESGVKEAMRKRWLIRSRC
jgi:hypothetical protein